MKSIWTLLDTGFGVNELANIKKENIQWQENSLILYEKRKRRCFGIS
jgi:hypothetical protein